MDVDTFDARRHGEDLRILINGHLSALVPGPVLPAPYMEARLRRTPRERIVDPWVAERRTLCATHGGRVVAAAHLARYRGDADVAPSYRGTAEIRWTLAEPGAAEPVAALAEAGRGVLRGWGVRQAL